MIYFYSGIFFIALIIVFFLLHENETFSSFFLKFYPQVLVSCFIFFFPKLLYSIYLPLLLESAFAITILTDIIDYSVFSIIPFITIFFSIIENIYYQKYSVILSSIWKSILVFIFFYFLIFFIKKIFKKDGLGLGDVYFYFIFVWYYDLYFLLLSFFFACLLALGFIFLYKIMFFKEPLKEMIPFIPFVYLSISLLKNGWWYQYIDTTIHFLQ